MRPAIFSMYILFSCILFLSAQNQGKENIAISIRSDKESYKRGEPIIIHFVLKNLQADSIKVFYPQYSIKQNDRCNILRVTWADSKGSVIQKNIAIGYEQGAPGMVIHPDVVTIKGRDSLKRDITFPFGETGDKNSILYWNHNYFVRNGEKETLVDTLPAGQYTMKILYKANRNLPCWKRSYEKVVGKPWYGEVISNEIKFEVKE
jgi:hypothetical protein